VRIRFETHRIHERGLRRIFRTLCAHHGEPCLRGGELRGRDIGLRGRAGADLSADQIFLNDVLANDLEVDLRQALRAEISVIRIRHVVRDGLQFALVGVDRRRFRALRGLHGRRDPATVVDQLRERQAERCIRTVVRSRRDAASTDRRTDPGRRAGRAGCGETALLIVDVIQSGGRGERRQESRAFEADCRGFHRDVATRDRE
jgi:hypothetical protein